MKLKILKGRPLVPGFSKGIALVSSKPISFLGGVDPDTGVVIERGHDLEGRGVGGKVLCFTHGSGSSVGSYVLYSLAKRHVGPKAIINLMADPVVVVGAIIANIPMIDQVDIKQIKSGDFVEVDAERGVVKVKEGG